jgi:hypothetical protein
MPTALDNGQRCPRKLLAAVVREALGGAVSQGLAVRRFILFGAVGSVRTKQPAEGTSSFCAAPELNA